MGAIKIVLLVAFVIVCALLVLLVVIQDDGENGMGGLLGGRGTAAFGSHSATVLTKTTFVLVVLFFLLAFGLAFLNKPRNAAHTLDDGTVTTEETVTSEEKPWYTNEAVEENATEASESVAE